MRKSSKCVFLVIQWTLAGTIGATGMEKKSMDVLCARAEVSLGHAARMRQVFAKAKRKERVVIGAIGGSITAGALAGTQDKRYVNQVAAWWRATFPEAKIELVNAGTGGFAAAWAG